MNIKNKSKLKWCFIVALCPDVMEFFGKFSKYILEQGDDCFLAATNKIAEYNKLKYFSSNIKVFSKVDWCEKNYKKELNKFEEFSWKDIFPDFSRNELYKEDYQDWMDIVSQAYQFFQFIFQKEKPDVVLFEMPAPVLAKVAYLVCKKYNIPFLGLVNSRIPGRVDVRDVEYDSSIIGKTFKQLNENNISQDERNFAKDFVNKFISHQVLPTYMDYQMNYPKQISLKKYLKKQIIIAKDCLKYFLERKKFRHFDHESERMIKYYWFARPIKSLKWRIKSLFPQKFDSINENDKFFLFPLHVEPEFAISALATYFSNQLNTITNIAFSLPFPYKLYVKEHPLFFEGRSDEFYKQIKRIPNVVFISPKEDTRSLIKKSEGVITLSSTVGLEAVLTGKHVYTLGNECFFYHPLSRRINGFEELKEKIEEDLKKNITDIDLESTNIRFILSYLKSTIPVNLFAASSGKDTNDYELIYTDIKKKFL